ncbi:MAG: hypothetical protein KDB80_00005, partial [Planctomycetes bacterium]|nr:hypothetical protein [Planctomycetota bacterium]
TRSELADLAKLVPPASSFVVCFRDANAFVAEVQSLVRAARPGAEAMVSLEALLNQTGLGVRERDLDLTKPIAIAASDDGGVVIVGAESPQDLADVANAPSAVSGSFVAFGMSGFEPEVGSASPIVTDLPTGQVAFRVDFDRLHEKILEARAEMQRQLMAFPGPGAEQAFAFYDGLFRRLLRGGLMDGFLELSKGEMRLALAMDMEFDAPQTDIDAAIALLGKTPVLPHEMSMVFADGMEPFQEAFDMEALLQGLPDDTGKLLFEAQKDLYRAMHGPTATRFAFDEHGMRGTMICRPSDVTAARTAATQYATKTSDALGISDVETGHQEVGEVTFDTASFKIDPTALIPDNGDPMQEDVGRKVMEMMYGDRTRVAIGSTKQDLLICVGVDDAGLDAVVEATTTDRPAPAIAAAREAVTKAKPWLLLHWDLGPLLRLVMSTVAETMPMAFPAEIAEDASAPLWMAASSAGRVQRFDLGIDVAATIAMFR